MVRLSGTRLAAAGIAASSSNGGGSDYVKMLGWSLGSFTSNSAIRKISEEVLALSIERKVPNLEEDCMETRTDSFLVHTEECFQTEMSCSIDSKNIVRKDEIGEWTVSIGEKRIDVYRKSTLVSRIVKPNHGKVLIDDAIFGGFSFSKDLDEALFAYVAEAEDEEKSKYTPGSHAHPDYSQDYGEKYKGIKQPMIYLVELTKGTVKAWFHDDTYSFCQPSFRPGTTTLAYRKVPRTNFKLGAVYCFNRPAEICIDEEVVSPASQRLARSPTWSPDGTRLCFLSADFATHDGPVRLMVYTPKKDVVEVASGLYGIVKIEHWADNTHLIVNELCRSTPTVSLISLDKASRTIFRRNAVACAAGAGHVVLHQQSLLHPGDLVITSIHSQDNDITVPLGPIGAVLGTYTTESTIPEFWTLPTETPSNPKSSILNVNNDLEAIIKLPNAEKPCPLIVMPHGGPHSASRATWSTPTAFLNARGMATLEINYRGSIGFDTYDALPGNIGSLDVEDCIAATQCALDTFRSCLDPSRVAVCGGSHGGFLAGHLAIQYPTLFKACCMRNPVTNLISMLSTSDIPDWIFVEALGNEWLHDPGLIFSSSLTINELKDKDIAILRRSSPITKVHTVTVPTLVALGLCDRRVPPSQGLEYFKALPETTPKCILTYNQDDHAIDRPWSTADHWLQIALWLEKYLSPAASSSPAS